LAGTACWRIWARRKIFGRKNGGVWENRAIDEPAREAAAAGTAVMMVRPATAAAAVW